MFLNICYSQGLDNEMVKVKGWKSIDLFEYSWNLLNSFFISTWYNWNEMIFYSLVRCKTALK